MGARMMRLANLINLVGAILLATVFLSACSGSPKLTPHSFSFDARRDSENVQILDYRYGESRMPGARPPIGALDTESVPQAVGIHGEMLRGDILYVKWRVNSTGEIYEDTVDLLQHLPDDISDHRIHFIVWGKQLYVFLISPDAQVPNPCPLKNELRRLGKSDDPFDRIFSMYCHRKIVGIYPKKINIKSRG